MDCDVDKFKSSCCINMQLLFVLLFIKYITDFFFLEIYKLK